MSSATQIAGDAADRDPAVGLAAVAALRRLAERLEEIQVANARDQGWSWQEIAAHLGVSRQAAHKKHAVRIGELSPAALGKLRGALKQLRRESGEVPGHRLEDFERLVARLHRGE